MGRVPAIRATETVPVTAWLLWGGAVVALAAAGFAALLDVRSDTSDATLLSVALALAALACLSRARSEPQERVAWVLLALGLLGLGSLAVIYVIDESAALDFPSGLPVGLLGYPLTLAAFILLARRRLAGLPRALWLDAAIGGLALAVIGGSLVLHGFLGHHDPTAAERSQLIYVIVDLALAGMLMVGGALAGGRHARTLWLLAAGASVLALVDAVYAARVGDGALAFTPALAVAWTAGCVIAAAAALLVDDAPTRGSRMRGWSLVAVPVIAPAAALAVTLIDRAHGLLTSLAAAVVLLSLLRLAISLIDNQRAEEVRRRQDEIRREREEAERANQAKTEFLSRMSHEVRTPLNSILGFAQLLVDDVDGAERESVERILRAGNHLRELIDDILDLSTIEAGETAIAIEPVAVGPAVDESVGLLEPLARRNSVRVVRRDADDAPAAVLADPGRLQQVLINLISNAIKYGGSESEVVVRSEGVGDRVRVSVIDAGPGIPPEHQAKLFLPFERGSARGSGVEGSGLGLALTKNLVERMQGHIGLETGPGGSTFWFELPAGDLAPAERPGDGDADASRVGSSGRITLLYIEDHVSNIALVEQLLARRGDYGLISATSGRGGLKLAGELLPDAVLLDLDLPDMRGEEVLAELRADPSTAEIPVIVVSADATSWRQEQLTRAGAAAYIVKPLQLASFLATLDGVLRRPASAP